MGTVDDFNAIRALNLQFEMQKAGSMCGTGSFFRVILIFPSEKFFPQRLVNTAFYSPILELRVFFVIEKFL